MNFGRVVIILWFFFEIGMFGGWSSSFQRQRLFFLLMILFLLGWFQCDSMISRVQASNRTYDDYYDEEMDEEEMEMEEQEETLIIEDKDSDEYPYVGFVGEIEPLNNETEITIVVQVCKHISIQLFFFFSLFHSFFIEVPHHSIFVFFS
jgi:hypothetical protein